MREKINNVLSSPDVRSDAPKDRTDKQTDVLPKFEERTFESKLIDNRRENKSSYDLKTRYGDHSKKNEVRFYRPEIVAVQNSGLSELNYVEFELIRTRTSRTQRR